MLNSLSIDTDQIADIYKLMIAVSAQVDITIHNSLIKNKDSITNTILPIALTSITEAGIVASNIEISKAVILKIYSEYILNTRCLSLNLKKFENRIRELDKDGIVHKIANIL